MKLRFSIASAIAYVMFATAVPANASILLFDFSGPSGTAMFQLDSNPTPNSFQTFLGSNQFSFNNVAGTYGGIPGTASTISFGDGIFASLSITAANLGFTQFNAPKLFTGLPSAPTFLTGSFTLINPFLGNGNLTISQAAVAQVPLPAALPLFASGLGALALLVRRRKRKVALSAL